VLLQALREAIGKLGRDARPNAVTSEAQVASKQGRDALRELERAGEYDGFTRNRPRRYRS